MRGKLKEGGHCNLKEVKTIKMVKPVVQIGRIIGRGAG